jgi:hypothetical protein
MFARVRAPQVERLLYMQESEVAPFAIHCTAVIPHGLMRGRTQGDGEIAVPELWWEWVDQAMMNNKLLISFN